MRSPIRRIGVSKLATVSECLTPQGMHVALKHYDKQPLSQFHHERIFSAAQRWQTLTSAGLMNYLEVLPAENQIVMEMMDRSAAVRLSEGYSDPRLVSYVLRGVLSALAYIHERGLLHVNIKPANVFFDEAGRAKLSDGLLVPASLPGTLPPPTNQKYLTPEHTSDSFGQMSPATDLYAAGFLALELLAGERFGRAFQGIGEDTKDDDLAWFQWHGSSQEAPPASQFCKTCPAQLESVIARLTKKNPKDRYASAVAALQDLPPETSPARQSASKSPVAAEPKRASFASDVLERPATGVVLAVASGPRAGEMLGTEATEFFIGFHPDCLLRFSHDQYPHANAKVLCRRGPEGWAVSRVTGENTFVNQRFLEDKLVLRSGDVLRLSARGPDVQFTMQSGGLAIKSLVSRFLPAQPAHQVSQQLRGPSDASAAPRAPGGVAPQASAPKRPGATPADVRPVAPSPPKRETVASQPRAVEAVPVAANPSLPSSPTAARGPVASGAVSTAGSAKGSWLSPKTWDKNQKNIATAIIGSILVVIVVILVPASPSKPKPQEEPPKVEGSEKSPGESSIPKADELAPVEPTTALPNGSTPTN